MATDKKGKGLNVGDSVLYVYNNPPAAFSLRGEVVQIVPIGTARDGEVLHMVDVRIDFVNKEPANKSQTVRVWSGQLEKYDAEGTMFV